MEQQESSPNKATKFYSFVGQLAGWVSAGAFTMALINKLNNSEFIFNPSDFLQAALYLILFAIFCSMASISRL